MTQQENKKSRSKKTEGTDTQTGSALLRMTFSNDGATDEEMAEIRRNMIPYLQRLADVPPEQMAVRLKTRDI